jgi:hypothetical protein
MQYRTLYDVRDEAGLFFLDTALLLALVWAVAFCVIVFALEGWLFEVKEAPSEQVAGQMIRLGLSVCGLSGLLLAAWLIAYLRGGPLDAPFGRAVWLFPGLLLVLVGWFTRKYPPTTPPPRPGTRRQRVVLILVPLLVEGAYSTAAGFGYRNLRGRQAALDAGEGSVVEGRVTRVGRVKQGPRIVVERTELRFEGRPCGHFGREVWLESGMRARVTHLQGTVLLFEIAAGAE